MNKKYILLLMFLEVSLLTFSQNVKVHNESFFCKNQLDKFKINYLHYFTSFKTKDIPEPLKNYIERIDRRKFCIAAPNKRFSKTDVVRSKRIPDKRLIFIANYQEFILLFFEQGGLVYNQRLVFCKIINNEVLDYCELCISDIITFEQLLKYLEIK